MDGLQKMDRVKPVRRMREDFEATMLNSGWPIDADEENDRGKLAEP